jgi:hypothetical protein
MLQGKDPEGFPPLQYLYKYFPRFPEDLKDWFFLLKDRLPYRHHSRNLLWKEYVQVRGDGSALQGGQRYSLSLSALV